MSTLSPSCAALLNEAVRLVASTPGYAAAGDELSQLLSRNRVRFNCEMQDRAQAGLLKSITLGPEPFEGSALSLAQTLIHECFHLHQNPLLKTVSFWNGVLTRRAVMARYERPAYRVAVDFLDAVKDAQPLLADEAEAEKRAIQQVFQSTFREPL